MIANTRLSNYLGAIERLKRGDYLPHRQPAQPAIQEPPYEPS